MNEEFYYLTVHQQLMLCLIGLIGICAIYAIAAIVEIILWYKDRKETKTKLDQLTNHNQNTTK